MRPSEQPDTALVKSVVIVVGGTSGWMCAAAIARMAPSDAIGEIHNCNLCSTAADQSRFSPPNGGSDTFLLNHQDYIDHHCAVRV